MSSYIVENETINRIVNFISHCADGSGYDGGRIITADIKWMIEKHNIEVGNDDQRWALGDKLQAMNCNAYQQRYGGDNVTYWETSYQFTYDFPPALIQAVKSMQCLLYQCSEGDVPDMPLYKALSAIIDSTAMLIVTSSPEYKIADWG